MNSQATEKGEGAGVPGKARLSILTPARREVSAEEVARFAAESEVPQVGGGGEGAKQSPVSPLPRAIPLQDDEKTDKPVIFKMTQTDRDLLDTVFSASTYKSRQQLFEAEFVPLLRRMADEMGLGSKK